MGWIKLTHHTLHFTVGFRNKEIVILAENQIITNIQTVKTQENSKLIQMRNYICKDTTGYIYRSILQRRPCGWWCWWVWADLVKWSLDKNSFMTLNLREYPILFLINLWNRDIAGHDQCLKPADRHLTCTWGCSATGCSFALRDVRWRIFGGVGTW